MLRALTTQLIREGRVTTTKARAKALRDEAERMITLAKDGSLASRRRAMGYIYDKQLVHALFEQAPERYADRDGGYTRVLRDGFRRGDNAEMGVIELVWAGGMQTVCAAVLHALWCGACGGAVRAQLSCDV